MRQGSAEHDTSITPGSALAELTVSIDQSYHVALSKQMHIHHQVIRDALRKKRGALASRIHLVAYFKKKIRAFTSLNPE